MWIKHAPDNIPAVITQFLVVLFGSSGFLFTVPGFSFGWVLWFKCGHFV